MDYYKLLCQIKLLCCMLTDDNTSGSKKDRLTKVLTIAMSNKDKEKKKQEERNRKSKETKEQRKKEEKAERERKAREEVEQRELQRQQRDKRQYDKHERNKHQQHSEKQKKSSPTPTGGARLPKKKEFRIHYTDYDIIGIILNSMNKKAVNKKVHLNKSGEIKEFSIELAKVICNVDNGNLITKRLLDNKERVKIYDHLNSEYDIQEDKSDKNQEIWPYYLNRSIYKRSGVNKILEAANPESVAMVNKNEEEDEKKYEEEDWEEEEGKKNEKEHTPSFSSSNSKTIKHSPPTSKERSRKRRKTLLPYRRERFSFLPISKKDSTHRSRKRDRTPTQNSSRKRGRTLSPHRSRKRRSTSSPNRSITLSPYRSRKRRRTPTQNISRKRGSDYRIPGTPRRLFN
jgi:hypothetical protein